MIRITINPVEQLQLQDTFAFVLHRTRIQRAGPQVGICYPSDFEWKRHLSDARNHPEFTALRGLLLADELFSPELVRPCDQLFGMETNIRSEYKYIRARTTVLNLFFCL
jgi:hypothetical protein